MSTFKNLKKGSNFLDKLHEEIEKMNSTEKTEKKVDDRFWKPTVDKAGNGMAIIRFLPVGPKDSDDDAPWVRIWDHGFKGPTGKWYIENSLTTLKKKDPLSELNSVLWNASEDDNSPQRKQARAQKRRLTYTSNIYVVSDPKNKETEGKVFLFKYGKKIFDKINEAINPPFDEMGRSIEDPAYDPTNAFNPFDFWTGANFKLQIRQVAGYRNYDTSIFMTPGPLSNDDAKLEEIWNQEYSIQEFLKPENFKSYEELKARLEEVLEEDVGMSEKPTNSVPTPRPQKMVQESSFSSMDEDDDDDLKAFRALAED